MPRAQSHILLALILVAAFIARVWGIGFGLPFVHARPDELLVVVKALGFFTADLNPRFFDYPALYLYLVGLLFFVYYAFGRVAGWFTSAAHFVSGTHGRWQALYLIGRGASAVFGTLTVLWVHRIASALFTRSVGLLASLFLALTFLHVRDSHYATTDATMTFFIVSATFALVQLHQARRRSHAIWAGVFAGLAMGTKYNAALLVAPMIVVEALHAWPLRHDPVTALRRTNLPLMLLLMGATFFATSPYLLLDYKTALRDFRALQESMSVGMTPPELLGPGWIYHVRFSLLHGLGLPLLTASLAGIGLMAWRYPETALLLISFPAAYYVVAGASANVFVRYMIPVLPFLCIFAAYLVDAVADVAARLGHVRQSVAAAAIGLIVIAPSAWSVVQFDTLLAREDSRVVAARWIESNVPRGASIFVTGNAYGHPPLEDRNDPKYRLIAFDYRANNFIEGRVRFLDEPDWIVVQRSALPYSHIPQLVIDMLPRYLLVNVIRAADLDVPGNVYDIQDAFFLPYGGFKGIRRPGPNLEIYQRRRQ